MKRGEIWWVDLEPTKGHEQQGQRHVLILSPDEFNQKTRLPVVVPITIGGNFARNIGFAVTLQGAGTKTAGIIRCDQPRALDLSVRGGKYKETVPGYVTEEALAKLALLFE
jgi:mRNA-degrading endonuclease toxin of MazEF toxin-antitoxin module